MTALHLAADQGLKEIVSLLLEKGASPAAKDKVFPSSQRVLLLLESCNTSATNAVMLMLSLFLSLYCMYVCMYVCAYIRIEWGHAFSIRHRGRLFRYGCRDSFVGKGC
jgi:hypothetical protein